MTGGLDRLKRLDCDFLVLGAGIVGVAIARELVGRYPEARIFLFEKEKVIGAHASGRNSGVIHAGFYYSADSLKARFCREGNQALHEYCGQKNIPLRRCGKLIVPRNESEYAQLDVLLQRATQNGVTLEYRSAAEAEILEPQLRCHRGVLWSPNTSTADPLAVLNEMIADLKTTGLRIFLGERLSYKADSDEWTSLNFRVTAGHVVNAAGLYADKIAHQMGEAHEMRVLPFKGLYKKYEGALAPKVLLYPVPNLKNPFLGVHFTMDPAGAAKLGPTALPALWREQYETWSGFSFTEMSEVVGNHLRLLRSLGREYFYQALAELKKSFGSGLADEAASLVKNFDPAAVSSGPRPGIRAQLMNTTSGTLVQDFVVRSSARATHVLNAVSPGWTSSIPFASYVVDQIEKHLPASSAAG